MDPLIKLECLLDTYRRHYERARKQAYMDSDYLFNRGQQFVFEFVIRDLESLRSLLEAPSDA